MKEFDREDLEFYLNDNLESNSDRSDEKLHLSVVSCRSLLDELLNHCDILINSNNNRSESFLTGIYAVRGKISHLKSKLNDN